MESFMGDVRFGLRMLGKRPAFAALAVATLALGIGANATLFSVVKGVLLEPLPYPEPERLVRVFDTQAENDRFGEGSSKANIADWRQRTETLEGIGAWYAMGRTLRSDHRAEVVVAAQVSTDFFTVLGVRPILGRTFTGDECDRAVFSRANAPRGPDPVLVLSHALWRQRFGADPDILGQTVSLERQPFQVIGVMPAGFSMPTPDVGLWIPWSFVEGARDQHYVSAIARLKPGVGLPQAQTEMSAIAAGLETEHPETNRGWGVRLVPLHDELVRRSRPALLMLLGAVGFVLLIACVNVANFQLARAAERGREVAVRAALGASRLRIARQLLVENLILAASGGIVGTLLAYWGVDLLKVVRPGGIPRLHEVGLDPGVLAFTFALSLATGILFGMAPALDGTRADLARGLRDEAGRSATPGVRRKRLRALLVVSQVALAVVLLSGAGLLLRSFANLRAVDPGFDPKNVLVLPVFLDAGTYDSGAKCRSYYARLVAEFESVPGVVRAGGATALPASPLGPDFDRPVWREGETPGPGGPERADIRMATTGYFDTVGMSVLAGRAFGAEDHPEASRVIVVNETLARRTWPGEDAVGKRLVIDYSSAGTYPYEVVGVVGDIRFYGLRSEPRPEVYIPHAQRSYLILNMAVRTSVGAAGLIPEVQRAVLRVDPEQPAHSVKPLAELVGATVESDRFAMLLLAGFAAAALALAIMGIYGLLSYLVSQRTSEIGIRMALGAEARHIFRMVLRQGGLLALLGVGIGVPAALAATRLLAGLLYGVNPMDPVTFGAVAGLLTAAALLACALPARRASRVDALSALHDE